MPKKAEKLLIIFILSIIITLNASAVKLYADSFQSELPFMIKVVNSKTGRGVPLVELRTINDVSYWTDSNGIIAFNEPGLMNEDIYFYISSDGYLYPEDSSGIRGQLVSIRPGGSVTLEIDQTNIAERLYRLTGEGIYRQSYMLGLPVPLDKPLLNARVTGSDSVQTIVYNDKLYWFWGDTGGPFHPLGNFRVTGATSKLPGKGGLDPDIGVNYEYFTDPANGFVKKMVPPLPDKAGVCWISPPMIIKDATGKDRLLTGYASLNGLTSLVARGVLVFNDETMQFERLAEFKSIGEDELRYPCGGGTLYEDNGKEYWLFTHPIPNIRVLSDYEAVQNQDQYEIYTPLKPGTKYAGKNTQLDRDKNGKLIWGWKKNTGHITQVQEEELIKLGLIDPKKDNPHYQFIDVDSGDRVQIHASTVRWNEYRKRWVMIGQQIGGTSFLGELWYGEADSITGPWGPMKKIITHKAYSFYNPVHHDYLDQDNGRVIYLEATYTAGFTNEAYTPHYNYNQIMYKLELDDPRLGLPLVYNPDKPDPTESGSPAEETEEPVDTEPTDADSTETEPTGTETASITPDDDGAHGTDDPNEVPSTGDYSFWHILLLILVNSVLMLIVVFLLKYKVYTRN